MEQIKIKPYAELIKYWELQNAYNRQSRYWGIPSVTSVLSIIELPPALKQLRAYSLKKFNDMMDKAWARGTLIHEHIEKTYLNKQFTTPNIPWSDAWLRFYTEQGYSWDPIHLELILKSKQVAGTADAIVMLDGKLTIVDWKTFGQRIEDSMIFKYKLQLAKYSWLYEQQEGQPIEQGKIVAFGKWGKYVIITFTKEELLGYLDIYNEVLNTFNGYYARFKDQLEKSDCNYSSIQESN